MAAPSNTGEGIAMMFTQAQTQNQDVNSDTNELNHGPWKVLTLNNIQATEVEKMRPLNSWIAFRTFYSQMFHGFPQKHISTLVLVLWHADPFKAKWAILAKAYSVIRDRIGKDLAPLDAFLSLCCPEIGIVSVDDYLKMFNWTVSMQDGLFALSQEVVPNLDEFSDTIRNCSMNEVDVISFCIRSGYMPDFDPSFNNIISINGQHLLATPSTFIEAITANPKAVAAQILGWEVDHSFLRISSDASIPSISSISSSIPLAPSPSIDYNWTGNMSSLYKPSDSHIDLAVPEFSATDISNPAALDGSLGYETHPADDAQTLAYTFGDSF